MELVRMLSLDGTTPFLFLSLWVVKKASQDASGSSKLIWLNHLSACQVSNEFFIFVCLMLEGTFLDGFRAGKGVYILPMLNLLHSSLFSR